MTTATLTSKSQITVPKEVRDSMQLGVGDKIEFVPARNGYRLIVIKPDFAKIRGMFKGRRARPLTVENMRKSISTMGSRMERGR